MIKPDTPSRRTTTGWLYVIPLILVLAAGWTWNRDRGLQAAAGVEQNQFPFEPAIDVDDPRRFQEVDGYVEDASTGLRLPTIPGLSPAEVFANNEDTIRAGGAAGLRAQNLEQPRPRGEVIDPALPNDRRYGIGPRPGSLTVSAIGVGAEVNPIGIDANRALRVPRRADLVGWWSGGAVPGENGPTVLVGHYDSRYAPGVFAKLKQLPVGELIVVSQTDGSTYTYFVTEVEVLSKRAFPTERVYGPTSESVLRLVTCGGKFDRKTGHYVDNTIVYAELLSATPSPWVTTTVPGPTTTEVGTTVLGPTSTLPVATLPVSTLPVSTLPVPTAPVPAIPVETVPASSVAPSTSATASPSLSTNPTTIPSPSLSTSPSTIPATVVETSVVLPETPAPPTLIPTTLGLPAETGP